MHRGVVVISICAADGSLTVARFIKDLFADKIKFELSDSMSAEKTYDILILNEAPPENISSANSRHTIINADDKSIARSLKSRMTNIITYGFNKKTTVTASSVTSDNIVVCVQRALCSISGNKIEEQEFAVSSTDAGKFTYELLAAVSCALVCDLKS